MFAHQQLVSQHGHQANQEQRSIGGTERKPSSNRKDTPHFLRQDLISADSMTLQKSE